MDAPLALVVMGVSGSGKSSIGKALANVEKMRGGTPLTDEDRWPWLAAVARAMEERLTKGAGIVVACSALKRVYRDRLRSVGPSVRFVHLHGSEALIGARLVRRADHFFDPRLLASQFATLEVPDPASEPDVLIVDAAASFATVIATVTAALGIGD